MGREELIEVIRRVVERVEALQEDEQSQSAPSSGCTFGDGICDVTTLYALGEES